MYFKSGFILLLISCLVSVKDAVRECVDGGFGSHINWYSSLDEGIRAAQTELKPIFLLVHRSWCPACKRLRPSLKNSQEFAELSNYFVMVNLDDESDAQLASQYQVDGGYVPRILFLDWNGGIRTEFWNKRGSGKYKYYYSDAYSVTSLMKEVLDFVTPIADYYRQQQYAQQSVTNYAGEL